MGSITQALRTAQSGLLVNQQILDVIAQNVANVNTEGYSRKIVQLENRILAGAGAGVQISEVGRKVDEGLLKSLRLELSDLNSLTVQEDYFARMQDLFGEPGSDTSISHIMEDFTTALESLVLSPDRSLEQTDVVRQAENIVLELQHISTVLQELRLQADAQISSAVEEINQLTNDIDQLNDDIIANGSVNRDVSDLKDQRDQKLDRLAELIDIRYFSRSDGDVVVLTSSGKTLVDTVPPGVTHDAAASVTPTTTHAEGDFDGIYIGSEIAANDITDELRGGQLKGLVDMRDDTLPNLQSQLDELASKMRDTFNQIHNRSAAFPGQQEYTGTRNLIASDTQTIKLDPTNSVDDTAIVLFDSTGAESTRTTLNTIMTDAGYSARGASDDWTIDDVAETMQRWLRNNGAGSATVGVNSDNKFAIALNTTSLNLTFRDQVSSTDGADQGDAEIAFDANGDGVTDETVSGFSNFFGLNDFFVDSQADNIWESDVLSANYVASAATLTFRDGNGAIGSISITAGESLQTVADNINLDGTLSESIRATVVPDGSGFRLRLSHQDGSSMTVTQASGNTFLTDAGVDVADVRTASQLDIRSDIKQTPSLITTGMVQWDADRGVAGEYYMSTGDDTVIGQLVEQFTSPNQFDVAGGLSAVNHTFTERAASIVGTNASLAGTNESRINSQGALTDSLQFKSDSTRGVNLDEELANLIIFEQAFSASARVINVIQKMFDALDRAI